MRVLTLTTIAALLIIALAAPSGTAAANPCANPTIQAAVGQLTHGTDGDDVIRGTSLVDAIDGRGGDDVVCGLGGDDIILGGDGRDRLLGGTGADYLSGGAGSDRIFGQGGDDRLTAGVDAQVVGDRLLFFSDRCDGGPGTDAEVQASTCDVYVSVEKPYLQVAPRD